VGCSSDPSSADRASAPGHSRNRTSGWHAAVATAGRSWAGSGRSPAQGRYFRRDTFVSCHRWSSRITSIGSPGGSARSRPSLSGCRGRAQVGRGRARVALRGVLSCPPLLRRRPRLNLGPGKVGQDVGQDGRRKRANGGLHRSHPWRISLSSVRTSDELHAPSARSQSRRATGLRHPP
jgi:hypothetical protein